MSIYWTENRDGSKTAYIDITIPGIDRVRESTGVRSTTENADQLAREYHSKRESDLWRQAKLGERPRYTWDEAVLKWLEEKSAKKSIRMDKARLRWLQPHFTGQYLDSIDRDAIERVMKIKEKHGVSPATVNRHAAVMRSILNMAYGEWHWIDSVPKVRMRTESDDKEVWMTREESDILIDELSVTAPHLADAVAFTLCTGLREMNCCHLQWEQINLEKRAMYVYKTKNGKSLGTPLTREAMEIIARRRGIHHQYVFTYDGRPMSRFNNYAYRKAVKRTMARIREQYGSLPSRLQDFNWHALRHTWATWLAQNNCPLEILQKLGGWRKIDMVLRYAHFATDHLAKYSELSARTNSNLKVVK